MIANNGDGNRRLLLFFIAVSCLFSYYFLVSSGLGFRSAATTSKVSRVHNSMRIVGLELEDYFQERSLFPPGKPFVGSLSDSALKGLGLEYDEWILEPDFVSMNLWDQAFPRIRRLMCWSWMILTVVLLICCRSKMLNVALFAGMVFFSLLAIYVMQPHIGSLLAFYSLVLPALICFVCLLVDVLWPWLKHRHQMGNEIILFSYLPAFQIVVAGVLLFYAFSVESEIKKLSNQYYLYTTDGKSAWVLQSYGPDGEYALALESLWVKSATDETLSLPGDLDERLNPSTYDPTNGTVSSGDIFR